MINETLEQLSAEVKQMRIQIMEITAEMNNSVPTAQIVTSDDLLSQQGTASVSASQPQDAHVNPDRHKTYAAACSAEIKQMVKSAFVESIKEQRSSERNSTSIVIHGMSESKMMRRTYMICSKILLAKVVLCAYVALARD